MRPLRDYEGEAQGIGAQLRRQFQNQLGRIRVVQTLFCAGGKEPTDAAVRWLGRLADDNFVNRTTYHESATEMARREGRRELALEIIASVKLDPTRLGKLNEQLREFEE